MSCQMFKLQIGMPLNRTKAPFTKSRLKSLNYKNGNFTHKYRDYPPVILKFATVYEVFNGRKLF